MIVVLMGYMGSGKSTIGMDLATILQYDFVDLDAYISENENATIPQIFSTRGEIYFRRKETEYLKELITLKDSFVLALGGGTPCYGQNLKLLLESEDVKTFYLKLSIPLLTERLFNERSKRPLISHLDSKEELLEFIGKHLFERVQYYNRSQVIIDTDYKSKKEIIEEILFGLI